MEERDNQVPWHSSLKIKEMDKSQSTLPDSTPSWVAENKRVQFYKMKGVDLDPSLTVPKQMEFGEGDWFRLVVLEPFSQNQKKLLFELQEFKEEYEKMEREMREFYQSISNNAPFPVEKMEKGVHVVYADEMGQDFLYKRAVICGEVKKVAVGGGEDPRSTVPIRWIDCDHTFRADCSELLFLASRFALLPPRAYQFELEGLEWYQQTRLHYNLVRKESGLFEGILYANLTENNRVVIYSDQFPSTDYAYGLNGHVICRLARECTPFQLPEVGKEKPEAYVVHATDAGEISIGFNSPFYSHYSSLMKKYATTEKFSRCKGLSVVPTNESLLMALHSTGQYRRCMTINTCENTQNVQVRFVDYGDTDTYSLDKLILAADIHPALVVIPPLVASVQLNGIPILDLESFWKVIPRNSQAAIFRCPDADTTFPVVELKLYDAENRYTVVGNGPEKPSEVRKQVEPIAYTEDEQVAETRSNLIIIVDKTLFDTYVGLAHFYRPGLTSFFFINVHHRNDTVSIRPAILGARLDSLEKAMRVTFESPLRGIKDIYAPDWEIGACFMIRSMKLGKVARCMMLAKPKDSMESIPVYLLDYGHVENVSPLQLKLLKDEYCFLIPAGCRAVLKMDEEVKRTSSTSVPGINQDGFKGCVTSVKADKDGLPIVYMDVIRFMTDKETRTFY